MGRGPGVLLPSVRARLLRAPALCLLPLVGCAVMPAWGAVPAYPAHLDRGQALSAERHFVRALKAFEEGIKLSRFLTGKLEEAEGKVEILLRDSKGEIREEEFKPEGEESPEEQSSPEGPD